MFARRNWFSPPLFFNKRSNLIILSLFDRGVIYISPLYEFLSRKGTFPSLGRFSNIQKYLLSLSFQNVKYSSTQYIYCPWKQVMGYTCPLLWPQSRDDFLLKPRFFRLGSGFGRYPTHTPATTPFPEKSWFQ